MEDSQSFSQAKRLKRNDGSPARSCESSPPDIPPQKRVRFSLLVEKFSYEQDDMELQEQSEWVKYLTDNYIFNHICCHLEKEHKIWDRLATSQGQVIEDAWYRYTAMVHDKLTQNGTLANFQRKFAEARASKSKHTVKDVSQQPTELPKQFTTQPQGKQQIIKVDQSWEDEDVTSPGSMSSRSVPSDSTYVGNTSVPVAGYVVQNFGSDGHVVTQIPAIQSQRAEYGKITKGRLKRPTIDWTIPAEPRQQQGERFNLIRAPGKSFLQSAHSRKDSNKLGGEQQFVGGNALQQIRGYSVQQPGWTEQQNDSRSECRQQAAQRTSWQSTASPEIMTVKNVQ